MAATAHLGEPFGEQDLDIVSLRPWARQQAPPGCGRERHRYLELGIVVAAGALIGVGPAMVEYVFALRMGLGIAGHSAEELVARLRHEVHGLPAGAVAGRAGELGGGREVRWKERGVVQLRTGAGSRVGAGIPGLGRDIADGVDDTERDFGRRHERRWGPA